jgi:hypothetical protein
MIDKVILSKILIASLFLTSCIGTNEEFDKIRDKVLENFGGRYNTEVQFSVGSVGITLSGWIMNLSDDENLPADIMDDVSSVQIGVYDKLKNATSPDFQLLKDIEPNMLSTGWKSIIRSSKDDEMSAVYVRKNPAEILERLFIISYDGEELVLVEVKGDLTEAIATVIKDKGIKINFSS